MIDYYLRGGAPPVSDARDNGLPKTLALGTQICFLINDIVVFEDVLRDIESDLFPRRAAMPTYHREVRWHTSQRRSRPLGA